MIQTTSFNMLDASDSFIAFTTILAVKLPRGTQVSGRIKAIQIHNLCRSALQELIIKDTKNETEQKNESKF